MSDTDSDNEFQQDIQALKRACSLTGVKTADDVIPKSSSLDDDDDDDIFDDMELLRGIKKRFSIPNKKDEEEVVMKLQRSEKQVGATNNIDLGKESSPNFFVTRINNRQGFPDSVDGRAADNYMSSNLTSATNVSEGHEPGSELVPAGDCGFPASAQAFVEAIKKNRTYQKFLCDKLIKVEARLEENKKLRERVKFLKAFREPWSKADNENLKKGIKQQIQEMMMQNLFSAKDPNSSNLDRMITRIKKREITPEEIRSFDSFLPKVSWEQLASMSLIGRSGPECESRWRNICEDPLINRGQWTNVEEKKMLHCFSNRGFSNWIDIAKEVKTNRTPYQCLARFQRSLNPSILNNEW
nr:myb domain protein 4r1 [Tanacetum cinerariifolium]